MNEAIKLLFICSKNKWRSPTAEKIWNNVSGFKANSAGLSSKARKVVSLRDINQADYIFVMEAKHRNRLFEKFNKTIGQKPVYILDIPDNYKFMDAELVELLKLKVSTFFDLDD